MGIFSLYLNTAAQSSYKKYIDQEKGCNEFGIQILQDSDFNYLIGNVNCFGEEPFTEIVKERCDSQSLLNKIYPNFVVNSRSSILIDSNILMVGMFNDNPNYEIIFCETKKSLDESIFDTLDLFPGNNHEINVIGLFNYNNSNIITYGQFSEDNGKVKSYLLWLNLNNSIDSLMFIDTIDEWSRISDVIIDRENNLVLSVEVVNVIDKIPFHHRKIYKFTQEKQKIQEYTSPAFLGDHSYCSLATDSHNNVVYSIAAEEDSYLHSLVAVNSEGEEMWKYVFQSDNLYTEYFISDIVSNTDGFVYGCGNYKNLNSRNFQSGFVFKIDSEGNLLWLNEFYDSEDVVDSDTDINKVLSYNSISIHNDTLITIGGSVFHNFLKESVKSDLLLLSLNKDGCFQGSPCTICDMRRLTSFVMSEKNWTEVNNYEMEGTQFNKKYTFNAQSTVLGGKEYFELLSSLTNSPENYMGTGAYIREQNGKVYIYSIFGEGELYNFTIQVGDTFYIAEEQELLVDSIALISLINGDLKKVLYLTALSPSNPTANKIVWIEDLGNVNGIFANDAPWRIDGDITDLLCVSLNTQELYRNKNIDSCWPLVLNNTEILAQKYRIRPTYATDFIFIDDLVDNVSFNIEVISLSGQTVLKNKDQSIIYIGDLIPGYYVVRLTNIYNTVSIFPFIKG